MGNLVNAKPSPRIVGGVIKWYQGDTFSIDLELELTDQDGEPIEIASTDTVKVSFRDNTDTVVKEFTFTDEDIVNNTVTLVFDSECTALFGKGRYSFDVYFISENRTTVVNDNPAAVE